MNPSKNSTKIDESSTKLNLRLQTIKPLCSYQQTTQQQPGKFKNQNRKTQNSKSTPGQPNDTI